MRIIKNLNNVVLLLGTYLLTSQTSTIGYVIQKQADDPVLRITTSQGITWHGHIATPPLPPPPGATSHILEFEFESPNYFQANNAGHLAVGIRADGVNTLDINNDGIPDRYRGRGVIIGSVNLYQQWRPECGPTSKTNTIAIEDFWLEGNCVYGHTTEGPQLKNNRRYKIKIESQHLPHSSPITKYAIWKKKGRKNILIGKSSLHEKTPPLNPSPTDLGGWFITELFSTHKWVFYIDNLHEYWQ